ncbi:hypothetical protein [Flavitalea sp.]|nr:hypothetical protein [Flavitalea sp.]
MQRNRISIVVFLLITINIFGQEEKTEETGDENLKGTHRFSLLIGHSHLSQGIMENGKRGWKAIPSWGLDYDYWISNHWAVGLQNDMMIESFEVEDHDQKVLERTRPFASIASVLFKPKDHVTFLGGAGGEFAKEGSFFVTRLGIESGWEMKNNWEFGVSLAYDIKWNGYDTWVVAFGISKLLRKHHGEH